MKLHWVDHLYRSVIKERINYRKMKPFLPVIVFLITCLLWWFLGTFYSDDLIQQEKKELQEDLIDISDCLTSNIYQRQAFLNGLSIFARSFSSNHLSEQDFSYYADGFLANDPVIRGVQFFPKSGPVLVYPIEGNEATVGRTLDDLVNDERPNVREDVRRTIESGKITLSDPYVLRQGGNGFIARMAVFEHDELVGIVVVILNLDELLLSSGLSTDNTGYLYALQDSSGKVFYGDEDIFFSDHVENRVVLPEGAWYLAGVPQSSWPGRSQEKIKFFYAAGLLLAFLLAGLTYSFLERQIHLSEMVVRQSEELLRQTKQISLAVEAAEIGFFDWDVTNNSVWFSPEWKRQIGYEISEIQDNFHEWESRVHPDDIEQAIAVEYDCIEKRKPKFEIEFRLQHKNGSYRNILSRGLLQTDEENESVRILGCHIDISKQKQSEIALSASERRFRGLAESIQDSIILFDRCPRPVYLNPAALQVFGLGQDASKFDTFHEVNRNNSAIPELKVQLRDVFASGVPAQNVVQWTGVNGLTIMDWRFSPVFSDNGEVEYVLALSRDITTQKRTEDALRESEVRFRNLADSGQALVWAAGVDKHCDYFNKTWLDFTGRQFEQELGFGWTDNIHPDDYQRCIEIYTTCFDRREKFSMDFRLRRYDDVYRWIQNDGSPRYNSRGEFIGYIGHCLDITIRKQAEEQLHVTRLELQKMLDEADQNRQVLLSVIEDQKMAEEKVNRLNIELEQRVKDRTKQLEAANKELEAFSYSVSHDLRSPLRGIDGWSLALLEDCFDDLDVTGQEYLNRIRKETRRMSDLIDDLLRLSRLSRTDMQVKMVNLSEMAIEIAGRLQEGANERKIEWLIQPDLNVKGDAHLLEIMMTNLIANAYKFSGKKEIARIEFGRTMVQDQPVFFIRDNGVGFDMSYARNLFGVFQRMHRQSDFPGTGIGLATVQRIINRHGGQIWAEAEKDVGATFYFTLQEEG